MKRGTFFGLLALFGFASLQAEPPSLIDLMPRVEDRTSMWWEDGFPGVVKDAPWRRCIETGYYKFVLDTQTLKAQLAGSELALNIDVDGKSYDCVRGGEWTRHRGPRLIESGRFFQRADVTDLVFEAEDGSKLNVDARFETAAWSDRLSLILSAHPGARPIQAGESSFGRVRGGFGLDGSNHFEIDSITVPETFTLELWAFVPDDYQAGDTPPWLVCKNFHEQADGNIGIMIRHGRNVEARMNIGGGRENLFVTARSRASELKLAAWNHLAVSYDGKMLRLFANGALAGETEINLKRTPIPGGLAFGRRQDNSGDGYRFRGVIDEVRLYDRALTLEELRLHFVKPEIDRPKLKPVSQWLFSESGKAALAQPRAEWENARLNISLGDLAESGDAQDGVSLVIDPAALVKIDPESEIAVTAERPIQFDPSLGWHVMNLDGVEPILPPEVEGPSNDSIERVRFTLSNPTDTEKTARLMFEKTARGFRQRIGTPITGLSAILRDQDGNPTGIPVQLSKNWHNDPEGGVYSGQWFHGISQVRLPAAAEVELELVLVYGHWGGLPAASHSQLSLIGWGSNQLWDQSALGSWGESICFEPDQVQGKCAITDVRPLMVSSMGEGKPWGWTSNVGGGDFFRLFDQAGGRVPHSGMQTTYHRQGPCLTEVSYAGRIGDGLRHSATVCLARGDDLLRGVYRIRLDVTQPTDFSRLAIFQIGADSYSQTGERAMAIGNESGLLREWKTQWGGDVYRTEPLEFPGRIRWASLHQAVPRENEKPGAWANRGIVIREWKARLGGQEAFPWIAERGLDRGAVQTSTLDILPPPGVMRLEPGDFIEATIEHIVVPQFAKDYYGPNKALREALESDENTWKMIQREALGNDRRVEMKIGILERIYPDIRIQTKDGAADFSLSGGLGHVPISFKGLKSHAGYQLLVDGVAVDQSVHGSDFWQTDFDPVTRTWSQTFNLPTGGDKVRAIRFFPES
ncbi:MAG: hypothetical protein ACI8UO_005165 [Verrucomicrobiales bacterium]|jgi:hypothetical protein